MADHSISVGQAAPGFSLSSSTGKAINLDDSAGRKMVVQLDLKTGKKKVIAFLHDLFWEKYGYALDGSFGSAIDEKGERLFISWDGWRKGQPKGWESAAMTVVHIPASERQP